jgi:hypothetical protein
MAQSANPFSTFILKIIDIFCMLQTDNLYFNIVTGILLHNLITYSPFQTKYYKTYPQVEIYADPQTFWFWTK